MRAVVIVDGQQMRVFEAGNQAGFALETLDGAVIRRNRAVNDLDRHVAANAGLVGAENRRHATLADFLDDLVRAEPGTDHDGPNSFSWRGCARSGAKKL